MTAITDGIPADTTVPSAHRRVTTTEPTPTEVDAAAGVAALVIRHPSMARPILAGVRVGLTALANADEPHEHVQDKP